MASAAPPTAAMAPNAKAQIRPVPASTGSRSKGGAVRPPAAARIRAARASARSTRQCTRRPRRGLRHMSRQL